MIEPFAYAYCPQDSHKWELHFDKPKEFWKIEPLYTHPVRHLENGYFLPMNVLNEPMQKSIKALIDHAKKGRWSNAIVRQDGVETTYEADWIKLLKPVNHPVKQLSDEDIKPLIKKYGIMDAYEYGDGVSLENVLAFANAIRKITE